MRFLLLPVAAVLLISGCGGDSETAGPKAAASPEDAYLAQLRENVPTGVVEKDEAGWLERGWDACVAISEDGLPEDTVVGQWASLQNVKAEYAAAGLGAAKAHLCDS